MNENVNESQICACAQLVILNVFNGFGCCHGLI